MTQVIRDWKILFNVCTSSYPSCQSGKSTLTKQQTNNNSNTAPKNSGWKFVHLRLTQCRAWYECIYRPISTYCKCMYCASLSLRRTVDLVCIGYNYRTPDSPQQQQREPFGRSFHFSKISDLPIPSTKGPSRIWLPPFERGTLKAYWSIVRIADCTVHVVLIRSPIGVTVFESTTF